MSAGTAPLKPQHDYYEILQVHPKATLAVIKKAYRTVLLELGHHPDHGGDEATAALITEAYRVLSDAGQRAAYDRLYFGATSAPPAEEAPRPVSSLIVLCPGCRTKNRVRSQALLSVAKCSRCGHSLTDLSAKRPRNWFAEVSSSVGHALDTVLPRKASTFTANAMRLAIPVLLLIGSGLMMAYAFTDLGPAGDPLVAADKLQEESRPDLARRVLRAAIEREPANPRLYEKLGDTYATQKLYDEAQSQYALAIRFDPDNSHLHTLRGDAFLRLNRLDEAEHCFKQALALDPHQAPALVALGNVVAKKQRFKDAATLYQQALKIKPDADVFYNLGMVCQWDGREHEATAAFMQALIADPNHRSSLVSLGALYYAQGKYDQAAAQLIKASYLRHTDLDLHLRLAQIYERTGRKKEAIQEWTICLDQGKGNPSVLEQARRALGRLDAPG